MRNFVITVNGKSYEVGVEEVGSAASLLSFPLQSRNRGPAVPGTQGCASNSAYRSESDSCKRRKSAFSFPRTYKIPPRRRRSNGEEGSTYSCTRSDEDG